MQSLPRVPKLAMEMTKQQYFDASNFVDNFENDTKDIKDKAMEPFAHAMDDIMDRVKPVLEKVRISFAPFQVPFALRCFSDLCRLYNVK